MKIEGAVTAMITEYPFNDIGSDDELPWPLATIGRKPLASEASAPVPSSLSS